VAVLSLGDLPAGAGGAAGGTDVSAGNVLARAPTGSSAVLSGDGVDVAAAGSLVAVPAVNSVDTSGGGRLEICLGDAANGVVVPGGVVVPEHAVMTAAAVTAARKIHARVLLSSQ